ncbi:Mitochondrial outer membrane protein porin [Serendipita indica DSM 11827]|uniref:Probable mitochondrial porin n=1 Tax=Serendipita indica (strain DSM 11827) TaxID=1109443 RepID=G4TMI1_SERID|nr:Mitochondrial outer membrane protein porin [Serendipita indica DSM 11827]CCA72529.1 probable mitochondrial porin [Serendipita indica DSM 11827]
MSLPVPVPPSWKDLGKSSNDLLGKDYPFHAIGLEIKTKTPSNVTFRVAGTRDAKSGAIAGDLEAKYTDNKYGTVLTNTWTTSNVLRTQLEVENQLAKGLKLEAHSSLNPEKGINSGLFNLTFKQPGYHARAALDLFHGSNITSDIVLARNGVLVGAETNYNVNDGSITRYATALGYTAPDYAVTVHGLSNMRLFSASYYHRVNADVEAGAKAVYNSASSSNAMNLEVGTKVYLDKAAFVKAKIASTGALALSYTQTLRPGVKAAFGVAIDTHKLQDPTIGGSPHRVGAQFTFEN